MDLDNTKYCGINLKNEFDEIIDDFGHKVILVKRHKLQQCNCVHQLTKSPKKDCPICLGTGFVTYSKEISVRNVMKYSLENYKYTEINDVVLNQNTFYIKKQDVPEADDLIIQLNFDEGKPYCDAYSNIYLIDNVAPLRQESGEIAFFCCSTEAIPINSEFKMKNIISGSINTSTEGYEIDINSKERITFINRPFDIKTKG